MVNSFIVAEDEPIKVNRLTLYPNPSVSQSSRITYTVDCDSQGICFELESRLLTFGLSADRILANLKSSYCGIITKCFPELDQELEPIPLVHF